ncbi:hypothetical protein FOCC_FOCC007757, partial [Frankliniella occidentalis]
MEAHGGSRAAGAVERTRERAPTAVHCGAIEGHLEAVQRLLELGLNKDTSDAGGHTPLCLAARGGRKCSGVLRPCRTHGAAPLERSSESVCWREAVRCAVRRGDLEMFTALIGELEARGVHWRDADIAHCVEKEGSADIVRALLARWPCSVRLKLDDTERLNDAARCGNADLVLNLLKLDDKSRTALHLAVEQGHTARAADLLQRDGESRTALHLAALGGHVGVIEALWEHTEQSTARREELLA